MQFFRGSEEDVSLRIQLDESLRVTRQGGNKTQRFTIRVGKRSHHFECAIEEDWIMQLENLTIRKA